MNYLDCRILEFITDLAIWKNFDLITPYELYIWNTLEGSILDSIMKIFFYV